MKPKSQLRYSPDANFILVGINCVDNISRLSWILNKELKINLTIAPSLSIHLAESEIIQQFPMYHNLNDHTKIRYRLISNRSEMGYLSYEDKHFDYFLQCFHTNKQHVEALVNQMKTNEDVCYVRTMECPNRKLLQSLIL